MSSIDYPPLVECCNLGEIPRMPTPESIGLRDTVHEHQSRVLDFQATPNQKEFQAPDCSLEPATLRHTARGIRWAMRQRKLLHSPCRAQIKARRSGASRLLVAADSMSRTHLLAALHDRNQMHFTEPTYLSGTLENAWAHARRAGACYNVVTDDVPYNGRIEVPMASS